MAMQEVENWVELEDRILRFDGVSIISPIDVPAFLMRGALPNSIRVTEINKDIDLFNQSCLESDLIGTDIFDIQLSPIEICIPEKYKHLDVVELILPRYKKVCQSYSKEEIEKSEIRIAQELNEFERRNILDLIKIIAFIIDEFKHSNQLWGVGRGSSCASYLLFLIGLHMVDPVKYDIPLSEFLK
jgi:hypothetical protein